MAGIVDKGCSINIVKQKSYVLRVSISSTNKELIIKIQQLIGYGSIYKIPKYTIRKSHNSKNNSKIKDKYIFIVLAHNAARFLFLVRPYLRTKTRKADIGLAFYKARLLCDRQNMYLQYRKIRALKERP